ncbi:MAG: rubrerythrin-like domain-containing protein [Halobacteriaceae archaeon]
MVRTDPFDPDEKRFECRSCQERLTTTAYRAECPECGGALRNIAVPRE